MKQLTEDHKRRMLIEQGERDKWLAAINTTFGHIEGTALAAGVYTTREGTKVTWGYINRILGQPSLIQESSMAKFPGSRIISQHELVVPAGIRLCSTDRDSHWG
ncbi:uncharacterized protein DS421_8g229510 [Arachis hypogaea]|nr:uncharacterized protein DS421_8g229510 [Arachis hypogaea]